MVRKERCLLTLVLCALAHNSKAWAGDAVPLTDPSLTEKAKGPQSPTYVATISPDSFAPLTALDSATPVDAANEAFSATEFRPRKRSLMDTAKTDYGGSDPMFRTTTVWQSLNQFRAQDRVRVLTLLESGGTSLSLQTSKKGDPSLQWSSSWTNRSQAGRGLLDRLLAASLSGIANRGNSSAHYAPASSSSSKPLTAAPVPSTK